MPKEKLKSKGKYCCAGGCTSSYTDKISLHLFPKELTRRKKWIKFIKDEQKNFDQPTCYQAICERHFTEDSYPMKYRIMDSMEKGKGFLYRQKMLNPDAVPTIHLKPSAISTDTIAPVASTSKSHTCGLSMRPVARKYAVSRIVEEYSKINTRGPGSSHDLQYQDTKIMSRSCSVNQDFGIGSRYQSRGTQLRRLGMRSVGIQRRPHIRSKGNQVDLITLPQKTSSIGVQCNMTFADFDDGKVMYPKLMQAKASPIQVDDEHYTDEAINIDGQDDNNCCDEDYAPSDIQSDDEDREDTCLPCQEVEQKFLVFESHLMTLFTTCPKCHSLTHPEKTIIGTMVSISQECFCGYNRKWTSQLMRGSVPAGNLEMSAAILFSGSIPSKALRCMNHMGVVCISSRTFHNHQQEYLLPSILQVWGVHQQRYIAMVQARGEKLTLGGDGRADTPGHSAKYGSYSMVDLEHMTVVDVQLVQCNEVKSSCHMEKEGLIRSVNFLKSHKLQIKEFVSDRHSQIVKHIREKMPETRHYFDVWHVSKGLKKKLLGVGKEKECDDVNMWIKSITNHMYWVAASTPDGNGDIMLAKWDSIMNHVTDVHHHNDSLFPSCQHDDLEEPRQWLKPDSKAFVEMEKCITSTQLRKAIRSLSPGPQTAAIEGFHSVINHFAPKMIGFSYSGMLGRLLLAALHFNENMQRPQAICKDGTKRYNIIYPKYKAHESSVKTVKVDCTYGYVDNLMRVVHNLATGDQEKACSLPVPPPSICSAYDRPNKSSAIQQHESRYK